MEGLRLGWGASYFVSKKCNMAHFVENTQMSRGMTPRWAALACFAALGAVSQEDDVAAYFGTLPAVIPHCASSGRQTRGALGVCIYVDPSGRLVHARDLHNVAGSGKQMLMDMLLRGTFGELRKEGRLPERWTSFCMVYTASGPSRTGRHARDATST